MLDPKVPELCVLSSEASEASGECDSASGDDGKSRMISVSSDGDDGHSAAVTGVKGTLGGAMAAGGSENVKNEGIEVEC
jgi:hypothetical protein